MNNKEILTIYETGLRTQDGRYNTFKTSQIKQRIENYIKIMEKTKPDDMTIVFLEKKYALIVTIPHIVQP